MFEALLNLYLKGWFHGILGSVARNLIGFAEARIANPIEKYDWDKLAWTLARGVLGGPILTYIFHMLRVFNLVQLEDPLLNGMIFLTAFVSDVGLKVLTDLAAKILSRQSGPE